MLEQLECAERAVAESSASVIKNALQSLLNACLVPSNGSSAQMARYYPRVAQLVLGTIAHDGAMFAAFSNPERETLLEAFFSAEFPPIDVFLALANAWSAEGARHAESMPASAAAVEALRQLQTLTERLLCTPERLIQLLTSLAASLPQATAPLVIDSLGALPDRITNCARALPSLSKRLEASVLFARVAAAACDIALSTTRNVAVASLQTPPAASSSATASACTLRCGCACCCAVGQPACALAGVLVGKFTRLGHAAAMADVLCAALQHVCTSTADKNQPAAAPVVSAAKPVCCCAAALRAVVCNVPANALDRVLEQLVARVSAGVMTTSGAVSAGAARASEAKEQIITAAAIGSSDPPAVSELESLRSSDRDRDASAAQLCDAFLRVFAPILRTGTRGDERATRVQYVLTHKFLFVFVLPWLSLRVLVLLLNAVDAKYERGASDASSQRRACRTCCRACNCTIDATTCPDRQPSTAVTDSGEPVLERCLRELARTWSSESFITYAQFEQQRYVSRAIVLCLRALFHSSILEPKSNESKCVNDAAKMDEASKISRLERVEGALGNSLPALLQGVHSRLRSPMEKKRRLATMVAEQFSSVVDPEQPLCFDDDQPTRAQPRNGDSSTSARLPAARPPGDDESIDLEEAEELLRLRLHDYTSEDERKLIVRAALDASSTSSRAPPPSSSSSSTATSSSTACAASANPPQLSASGLAPLDATLRSDDTGDMAEVRAPRYLRDCLDMLRKRDSNSGANAVVIDGTAGSKSDRALPVVETALRSCAKLVQARPDDLEEVCSELVATLLHLGTWSELDSDELEAVRLDSLEALVTCCPLRAVPVLIDSFYRENQTISQRIDALSVLERSAQNLSSLGPPHPQPQFTGLPSPSALSASPQRSNLSAAGAAPAATTGSADAGVLGERKGRGADRVSEVQARGDALRMSVELDSAVNGLSVSAAGPEAGSHGTPATPIRRARWQDTVRRWGQRKSRAPLSGVNQFARMATHFFFPLIRKASRASTTTVRVLSQEPLVLCRLLCTLGSFVFLSGPFGADTASMADALLDLLWATRVHQNAGVRRATLFALSRVILAVPSFWLTATACKDAGEMSEWLGDVQRKDPDSETRALALACLFALRDQVGATAAAGDGTSAQASNSSAFPASVRMQLTAIAAGTLNLPAGLRLASFSKLPQR